MLEPTSTNHFFWGENTVEVSKDDATQIIFILGYAVSAGVCKYIKPEDITKLLERLNPPQREV